MNKTDANDADGLAHLAEVKFYKEVRVKGFESMLTRTRLGARAQMLKVSTQLSNQIRGMMKTFGLVTPKGAGGVFDANVRELLATNAGLEQIILPLLDAWKAIRVRTAELSRQLIASARNDTQCQLLQSVPGIGAITASTFVAAVEDPDNFARSRSVGAWIGLTTKRYQSGEVDHNGHISRRGDARLRGLLYEAATVLLTRTSTESVLRDWGLKLWETIGYKRAAVAVARKLAVIMHKMLKTGELFDAGKPAIA